MHSELPQCTTLMKSDRGQTKARQDEKLHVNIRSNHPVPLDVCTHQKTCRHSVMPGRSSKSRQMGHCEQQHHAHPQRGHSRLEGGCPNSASFTTN